MKIGSEDIFLERLRKEIDLTNEQFSVIWVLQICFWVSIYLCHNWNLEAAES